MGTVKREMRWEKGVRRRESDADLTRPKSEESPNNFSPRCPTFMILSVHSWPSPDPPTHLPETEPTPTNPSHLSFDGHYYCPLNLFQRRSLWPLQKQPHALPSLCLLSFVRITKWQRKRSGKNQYSRPKGLCIRSHWFQILHTPTFLGRVHIVILIFLVYWLTNDTIYFMWLN